MGRPRKRAREDNANDEIDFNNVEEMPAFDFDSVLPAQIVGIPGTGIPLSLEPQIPSISFGDPEPPLTWFDPLLQNAGVGQPGQNFRSMLPYVNMPDLNASSIQTPGASYPTPPHMNGGALSPQQGTCICLPNMYLTLSDISATKDWAFPMQVHKLKVALQTTDSVIKCPTCPHETTSAMQNLMMLTTLLTTVTDCYRKILHTIDVEAARAEAAGTSIQYRMGDTNPERWHLHTGTNDCPMGINVDLDPPEYRMLARKVIKADVLGASNPSQNQTSILGLVKRLEERQHEWHNGVSSAEMRAHFSRGGQECRPEAGDFTCLKLVGMIRNHVTLLGL
jgi:hypothetical protein